MTYKEIYNGINGMRKQAFLNKVKMIKRAALGNKIQDKLNDWFLGPLAKPLNAAGLWVGNKVGEGIYGKQTGSFPPDSIVPAPQVNTLNWADINNRLDQLKDSIGPLPPPVDRYQLERGPVKKYKPTPARQLVDSITNDPFYPIIEGIGKEIVAPIYHGLKPLFSNPTVKGKSQGLGALRGLNYQPPRGIGQSIKGALAQSLIEFMRNNPDIMANISTLNN